MSRPRTKASLNYRPASHTIQNLRLQMWQTALLFWEASYRRRDGLPWHHWHLETHSIAEGLVKNRNGRTGVWDILGA